MSYIIEGSRLPVGKANGYYKNVIPEVFTGALIKSFFEKYPTIKSELDEVILGCALGTGGNMARYAMLEAGLSETIPAATVDVQCASGLKAIILADQQIKAGANCVLAGGMESNSLAPRRQYHPKDQRFVNSDTYYTQATFAPDRFGESSLLAAAEIVAKKFEITKELMMEWTLESNKKAIEAIQNAYLETIISPYESYHLDQTVKSNLTLERLINSQTSALIDHTNTAHLHDGACIHLLASEQFLNANNFKPNFKILATATAAGEPSLAPMGVIWATEALLKKTGINIDEIDLFEVNESFAINALAFVKHFKVIPSKINIFVGNLAFGHPFGASGAINLLHLMQAMKLKNVKKGLVSIAAAGGLGIAILIEKV
jgi:acetyl-CoA C-acetyltransferase